MEVLPVLTAHLALAAVKSVPQLTLAVIDLDLPETSGLELLGRIKELRPDVRVIAITGVLPGYVLEVATYLGADTALLKPLTAEWIRTVQEIKGRTAIV
jgi:CheY-like chemotaxis protein